MRISEIHIDGFGVLADKHIVGLTSGINAIHGPNEFGKSTLLAFVRRILFGFTASAKTNPYPALHGGAYGGRLVCQLENGEIFTAARTTGPHGGRLTVTTGSGQLSGQDELNRILGHIGRVFFENVYAISLDELQVLDSLNTEEVKRHIYAAGLGLGGVSLADVQKHFRGQSDSLYKPGGSAQSIAKLHRDMKQLEGDIRDIQKELARYDSLVAERDRLAEELGRLDGEVRWLQQIQRYLERQGELFPVYLDYARAEDELAGLEELPEVSERAVETFEGMKAELDTLSGRIEEDEEQLLSLERERESLKYNERIIEQEPAVVALQRMTEHLNSATRDKGPVEAERQALDGSIRERVAQIGADSSGDKIRQFRLTHQQEDYVAATSAKLNEERRRVGSARDKLDLHRERRAAESSRRIAAPSYATYAVYAALLLGLTGVIWASVSSEWAFVGISATLVAVVLAVVVGLRMREGIRSVDPLEEELLGKLEEAQTEFGRAENEWHAFLGSVGLDERLTPEGASAVVTSIQRIQYDLSQLDALDVRIGQMQDTIDRAERIHDELRPCVDEAQLSTDIGANIEIFDRILREAKETKRHSEDLGKQIAGVSARIAAREEDRAAQETELQEYVSSQGADDEGDLRAKHEKKTRRIEVARVLAECERSIQKSVGTGDHFSQFIESTRTKTPDQIASELEEVNGELDGLTNERLERSEATGKLKNEIERLSSSEDLLARQSEMETKRQQLQDCSVDWVVSQIALSALAEAISTHENTRQPEVIKAAQGIFSTVTNRRYPGIVKPVDSDDILIGDESGNRRTVVELSRGTREQLYLAMRLGLIAVYEQLSEPMPIIMDDILANFDDERGPLAIEALKEFAKDRQALVMTCHQSTFDMYRNLGAHEVILD